MAIDLDVAAVAALARLELTADETQLYQGQLRRVLEYAGKLSEVDVAGIESNAHAAPIFNVFREDETRPGLTSKEVLREAPRSAQQLFIVPKVVE